LSIKSLTQSQAKSSNPKDCVFGKATNSCKLYLIQQVGKPFKAMTTLS